MQLPSDRVVMVDVDDTLVCWNVSEFPAEDHFKIRGPNGLVTLVRHEKNINLVRKFWKLGYTIVVWSGTGHKWAEKVARSVGLDDVVSLYMSKPMYYIDDKPSQEWMGPRAWRDPVTGNSV